MFRKSLLAVLALLIAAVAAWAAGIDQPGDVHLIRPEDLPPPFATKSTDNPPNVVARPEFPHGFHPPPGDFERFAERAFGDVIVLCAFDGVIK